MKSKPVQRRPRARLIHVRTYPTTLHNPLSLNSQSSENMFLELGPYGLLSIFLVFPKTWILHKGCSRGHVVSQTIVYQPISLPPRKQKYHHKSKYKYFRSLRVYIHICIYVRVSEHTTLFPCLGGENSKGDADVRELGLLAPGGAASRATVPTVSKASA